MYITAFNTNMNILYCSVSVSRTQRVYVRELLTYSRALSVIFSRTPSKARTGAAHRVLPCRGTPCRTERCSASRHIPALPFPVNLHTRHIFRRCMARCCSPTRAAAVAYACWGRHAGACRSALQPAQHNRGDTDRSRYSFCSSNSWCGPGCEYSRTPHRRTCGGMSISCLSSAPSYNTARGGAGRPLQCTPVATATSTLATTCSLLLMLYILTVLYTALASHLLLYPRARTITVSSFRVTRGLWECEGS